MHSRRHTQQRHETCEELAQSARLSRSDQWRHAECGTFALRSRRKADPGTVDCEKAQRLWTTALSIPTALGWYETLRCLSRRRLLLPSPEVLGRRREGSDKFLTDARVDGKNSFWRC